MREKRKRTATSAGLRGGEEEARAGSEPFEGAEAELLARGGEERTLAVGALRGMTGSGEPNQQWDQSAI